MRRTRYLIMTLIGVLVVLGFAVNNVYGENSPDSNLTEKDGSLDAENNIEYNYFFGLNPSGLEVIATYGKLPEFETEEQRQNWSYNLKELGQNLKDELFPGYMYPHGKILTVGKNSRGYLVISFYENLTTEDPLLDELYTIIDENAKKMGIQEVPVEFEHGVYYQEIEIDLDILAGPEIKAMEEYMKSGRDLYKPEVIATYGKIPKFETKEQWSNWVNKVLPEVDEGLGHKIADTYFYPAGPLIAFGYGSEGFEATVLQNLTIEKPLMDEIYGIIDEEAKKKDIQEVPLRFVLGDFIQPDILLVDEDPNEEMPLPDELSNKNISNSDKASSKPVPDFGLLGVLIFFFGGWLFRRKRV